MVKQCDIQLVIIGPNWLNVTDDSGRRLEDPTDFVRIELEAALSRDIPVVPLLVGGARMPPDEALPGDIKELSFRNGLPIRPDPDFHRDMSRLIEGLEDHVEPQASPVEEAALPVEAEAPPAPPPIPEPIVEEAAPPVAAPAPTPAQTPPPARAEPVSRAAVTSIPAEKAPIARVSFVRRWWRVGAVLLAVVWLLLGSRSMMALVSAAIAGTVAFDHLRMKRWLRFGAFLALVLSGLVGFSFGYVSPLIWFPVAAFVLIWAIVDAIRNEAV
jgi:hypothetical protein